MDVCMFAESLKATLHARMLPLAKSLESKGVHCKVILPINWDRYAKKPLNNILSILLTHNIDHYLKVLKYNFDIVFIGRISSLHIWFLQKLYKLKKIKIIFDLDDALFLPISKILGVKFRSPKFSHLDRIVKNSDYVTVNGRYLLRYVRPLNQKVDVIPDPIDTNLFISRSKNRSDKIVIGWEGNPKVHYENLAMLVKPLEKLGQKYGIKFKIVSYLGDIKVKQLFKKLESLIEIDYGLDHWVPLDKFAKSLSEFDIMVAPLKRTLWYEGKSVSRVGYGMAMSIPVVASPVGEQKYIIKHGYNGFIAENEEDWFRHLSTLIEDDNLRRRIGRNGKKTVDEELSLDACSRKLYTILKNLIES